MLHIENSVFAPAFSFISKKKSERVCGAKYVMKLRLVRTTTTMANGQKWSIFRI